ncbi:MAG: hypothetical protein ACL7BU_05745 [Candidatus Phlomobacter fragariae]
MGQSHKQQLHGQQQTNNNHVRPMKGRLITALKVLGNLVAQFRCRIKIYTLHQQ